MIRALIFPGQGSQSIGMGKEVFDSFPEAREVFEEVDDTLNQSLSKLIFEGPIEDLTLTENTQPALMATSIAVLRVIEKQSGKKIPELASYVAGHSLGEYTALTAAGSISLSDAASLLRTRGQAMQDAVPTGQGGMAAIIGVDIKIAEKIAHEAAGGDICQVANDNSPGQVVISGSKDAIDRAGEVANKYGAKRFLPLNVSAPFHCKLMEPAANVMKDALEKTEVSSPSVPLVANVTADEVTDPQTIRDFLVKQVTGEVRWRQTIGHLWSKEVESTVEIGAGKVLSGLTKRITGDLEAISVGTPEDIDNFLATL